MGTVVLSNVEAALRDSILESFRKQGFVTGTCLGIPNADRQAYREIQIKAKEMQMASHRKFIVGMADKAEGLCSDGRDIDPQVIRLELREVMGGTFQERLFRWWNYVWWSMPYQHAYGRQMRFFLWDVAHDLPFGMVYLQSPVLRMKSRDRFLGIPKDKLDYWVNMSMSAQRVGALPPYNGLIGGKMAALSLASNEVRNAYRKKYAGSMTLMAGRTVPADLLFVTTTGAFGKSAMYDRLVYGRRLVCQHIGSTNGSGTFHLSDDLTAGIYSVLRSHGIDTRTTFGHGPSVRIKLVKRGLGMLGLGGFYNHGIRRHVYLFRLAENLERLIAGHDSEPVWPDRPFDDMAKHWHGRWAMPRSRRITGWREFDSARFFNNVRAMLGTKTDR